MHKPFQLIRNTERLVVGAPKAFFPQIHYMIQNNIGLLLSIHKFFLVEIELRVVNQNKHTKKNFWGLLRFRHVQTSLENMFLFCCFFLFLWVFDSLGLIQINPNQI